MKWENIFKTICGIGGALASYLLGVERSAWSVACLVVAGLSQGQLKGNCQVR